MSLHIGFKPKVFSINVRGHPARYGTFFLMKYRRKRHRQKGGDYL